MMLICQICHLMANVTKCQMFSKFFGNFHNFWHFSWATFTIFSHLSGIFTTDAIFWQILANFATFRHPLGIFHNLWQILALFAYFLHLQATFGNFVGNICQFLPCFGNFGQLLPCFGSLLQLLANLAIFGNCKHLWADFGIFLATIGCSHTLLATFMKFLSLCQFWQFLPIIAIFWQLLPLMLPYHHLNNLSSCHLFKFSSYHLISL